MLKQAKGRAKWAERSDFNIAFESTIEMLLFGGAPFIGLWLLGWQQPELTTILGIAAGLLAIYWVCFSHIRSGLREAQMEPLL